jgi:hypothetical protein
VREIDDLSAERLWIMFFRHFDRKHGIALVKELWLMPIVHIGGGQ